MKIYKLLVIPILLIGCATIRTGPSQTAQSFEGKINELLIVFDSSPLGATALYVKDEELSRLILPFRKFNIKSELFYYSDLNRNADKDLDEKCGDYKYILIIKPIGAQRFTYNLHIIENQSRERIWTSQVYVPPDWDKSRFHRFEEMGQKIVQDMSADGLMSAE